MISIKVIALILLLMRLASGVFIFTVLRKQAALLRLPINPELRRFRLVLFALSLAIFVGNIIPVIIDGATLFYATDRPASLSLLSVSYALSNALTALLSSYFIFMLYRLAANEKEITDYTQHSLELELKGDKRKEK